MTHTPSPDCCRCFTSLPSAGSLSPFLDDKLLASVAQHKLSKLQGGGLKPDGARTYVQGLGVISRAVGYR
jgi:hypothetical protein